MVLRLIEEGHPLDYVIFYNTGMEFRAIFHNWEKLKKIIEGYGAIPVTLQPETDFLFDMLIRPVQYRDKSKGEHYGYDWCGGCARWRTSHKVSTINTFLDSLDCEEYVQYIGIAADEPKRIEEEKNKIYPLVDWDMTEDNCLAYCYDRGFDWKEEGVELYSILDRVSCWCCKNKNLKELRNMYHFLPKYWSYLKGMQSRIDRPFYGNQTIFELEERFKEEDRIAELKRIEEEKYRQIDMFEHMETLK